MCFFFNFILCLNLKHCADLVAKDLSLSLSQFSFLLNKQSTKESYKSTRLHSLSLQSPLLYSISCILRKAVLSRSAAPDSLATPGL